MKRRDYWEPVAVAARRRLLVNPPTLRPELRSILASLLWHNRGEGRIGAYIEAVWCLSEGCTFPEAVLPVSDRDLEAVMQYLPDKVREAVVEYVEDELCPGMASTYDGERLYERLFLLGWIEGRWLEPERDRDPLSW